MYSSCCCSVCVAVVVLVIRSWQVTFLHLFHHASIIVIVGSLLPFGK